MQAKTQIAILIGLMANAVIFGFGAIVVLSVPPLAANAMVALPVVVAVSFALSPLVGWYLAPRAMARNWREGAYRPIRTRR
ncbi:hypothetical protein [Amorphus coralli]|uniref:hypothetical protein n=1 Tax=Amorphus coralli TaxID=340680 RepID=UPI00036D4E93|nr:hypothetical protein [Amorphus coralli]